MYSQSLPPLLPRPSPRLLPPPPSSLKYLAFFVVEYPCLYPHDMSGNHDVPIGDASASQPKKSHNRKRNKNRHTSSNVNKDNGISEVN